MELELAQLSSQSIRKMTQADLEMVLAWRNHINVRRFMYTQNEISMTEHSRWFECANIDTKRHLLVYQMGDQPLGFINLHEISAGGIANWGFYVAPNAPRGTGSALGCTVLKYAFHTLNLHKLCGQVIEFNDRSIRLHLKLGFSKEGILRKHHFDGQIYHDVWCFGLIAETCQINI